MQLPIIKSGLMAVVQPHATASYESRTYLASLIEHATIGIQKLTKKKVKLTTNSFLPQTTVFSIVNQQDAQEDITKLNANAILKVNAILETLCLFLRKLKR